MAARGIAQRGERAVAAWCARAVERYDVELVNHFSAEEEVLFPAIRAALGEAPLVDELIAEHREMERLVGELRNKPDQGVLEEFLELLRNHIRREENELFELAQERMGAGALTALEAPLKSRVAEICLSVENEET
jgi:hemerythrin-like domain-containing protein